MGLLVEGSVTSSVSDPMANPRPPVLP